MLCRKCDKQHDGKTKTCADCLIKVDQWRRNNPGKRAAQAKKWSKTKNGKESLRKAAETQREKLKLLGIYKEKTDVYRKKATLKAVSTLSDRYVKSVIIRSLPKRISSLLIPQELIETTRVNLKLKRLLKETKK